MTTPQPDQQPDEGLSPAEEAVIAALALYFASTAAVSAVMLPKRLVEQLMALGLSARAIRAAGRAAMAPPLTGRGRYGSPARGATTTALRGVKSEEPTMRARYVLAAAKRLTRATTLGVLPQALRQEKTYLAGHRRAGQNRANAAARLDRVAAESGPWLRWATKNDDRVEADCRALAGRVFTVDNLPVVNGIPAIPGALHVRCRCWPEPAFDRTQSLPTIRALPVGV